MRAVVSYEGANESAMRVVMGQLCEGSNGSAMRMVMSQL